MRGRLSSVQQIMIITGLTGAFLANYVLAHTAGSSTAPFWLGLPAWRWMFWMQTIPAAIFFWQPAGHPGKPALPGRQGQGGPGRGRPVRLFGAGQGAKKVAEIRASLAVDHQPKFSDLLDPRPRSCARSCGPAWSWPCSSSWSASTSSSTTARCCGSRWASPRTTPEDQHPVGHAVDPGLPGRHRRDRQDRPQAAAADRLGGHGRDPGRADLVLLDRHHGERRAAPGHPDRPDRPDRRQRSMWCSSTSAGAR
jgi:hypothetical protein